MVLGNCKVGTLQNLAIVGVTKFLTDDPTNEQTNGTNLEPGVGPGRCFHLRIVHTIPGLTCFINSYITKCLLKPSFYKSISAICLIYTVFVYGFYSMTGRIQYSFLKFDREPR